MNVEGAEVEQLRRYLLKGGHPLKPLLGAHAAMKRYDVLGKP